MKKASPTQINSPEQRITKICPNCNRLLPYFLFKKEVICPVCHSDIEIIRQKQGCIFYAVALSIISIVFTPVFDWVFNNGELSFFRIMILCSLILVLYIFEKICFLSVQIKHKKTKIKSE